MRNLDIGEVAEQCGVPASTLRFYEEKGLIRSNGRRGLRRVFPAGVLERLALIALGRAAGFSLDEIAAMFAPDGRLRIDRDKLAAKAKELDATISQLTAMRDGLKHAAACKAPSHMECPKFRRIVQAAASGALGARRSREARKALPDRGSRRGRSGSPSGHSPRR
jgi:DNA-binding transcriptional MerR regulator